MQTSKALVVEEDDAIIVYVSHILKQIGIQAEGVRNGRMAVEQAVELQPELIVCNYSVQELDGLEVLRELQRQPKTRHIPLIFMSSDPSPSLQRKTKHLSADAFIAKPFRPNALLEKVGEVLSGNQGAAPQD